MAVYVSEQTAPATPTAGNVVLYAKTDGFIYSKDDAGAESKITVSSATTTVEGLVELATQTEADAGTAGKALTADLVGHDVRTWTPVVTSTTGTITTVGAVSGRYYRIGTFVFFRVSAAITTNGTGAGAVIITLPSAEGNVSVGYFVTGRANSVSGKQLLGACGAGTLNMTVQNYDDSYPAADGETLILSGFYEVA